MKDYFSHDYNARNDKKLVTASMKFGLEAIGAYWCIVEMIYEEGGYLPISEYERITFELRTSNELTSYLIEESGLFENDGNVFWSNTAIERLKMRADKSDKARKSIEARWKRKGDTNVLQSNNGSNTSKVKENKGKNNVLPWKQDFKVYLSDLRDAYCKIISDKEWIQKQEKFNPGVDIALSVEKVCVNYWSTEAGWKKKKGSRITTIDWPSTFANAISITSNKVWKKTTQNEESHIHTA